VKKSAKKVVANLAEGIADIIASNAELQAKQQL